MKLSQKHFSFPSQAGKIRPTPLPLTFFAQTPSPLHIFAWTLSPPLLTFCIVLSPCYLLERIALKSTLLYDTLRNEIDFCVSGVYLTQRIHYMLECRSSVVMTTEMRMRQMILIRTSQRRNSVISKKSRSGKGFYHKFKNSY